MIWNFTRLDEECELLIFEEWLDVDDGGRAPEPVNWAEFEVLVLIDDIDPVFCGVGLFVPNPPLPGPDGPPVSAVEYIILIFTNKTHSLFKNGAIVVYNLPYRKFFLNLFLDCPQVLIEAFLLQTDHRFPEVEEFPHCHSRIYWYLAYCLQEEI